jgi:hypothetical protein
MSEPPFYPIKISIFVPEKTRIAKGSATNVPISLCPGNVTDNFSKKQSKKQ